MLKVKRLDARAILPTVAHPGEDLGYDLYALEDTILRAGVLTKVSTGIAAYEEKPYGFEAHGSVTGWLGLPMVNYVGSKLKYGLLIRDRSSMAAKGVTASGGVIDAGYRGELVVMLTYSVSGQDYVTVDDNVCHCGNPRNDHPYRHPFVPKRVPGFQIKAGDKIAQALPIPVLTAAVVVVDDLGESSRGEKGFGSSGQ